MGLVELGERPGTLQQQISRFARHEPIELTAQALRS
jgi:hypothetical protein